MAIRRVIIGLGTGRCGTQSLSTILSNQRDCIVTHEKIRPPVWGYKFEELRDYLNTLPISNVIGDVSFYNLPHSKELLHTYPGVKFIVLKRSRSEVVESYMKKTTFNGVNRNHWQIHDGSEYSKCIWDLAYPKFDAKDKESALQAYWDYYYEECEKIPEEKRYSIDVSDLNSQDNCIKMLKWCGIESPTYKHVHINKKKKS